MGGLVEVVRSSFCTVTQDANSFNAAPALITSGMYNLQASKHVRAAAIIQLAVACPGHIVKPTFKPPSSTSKDASVVNVIWAMKTDMSSMRNSMLHSTQKES